MLGPLLLSASRNRRARQVVTSAPGLRRVVSRFVPGAETGDVLAVTRNLISADLAVTIDYLGEDVRDTAQARTVRDNYTRLLGQLADLGLARGAEVSLKLSAVGRALAPDGDRVALDNARAICAAAAAAGTTVTLDMEDHTRVTATLRLLAELRPDFPDLGCVLQSYLRRSADDCAGLTAAGSRVRLCKGAYRAPDGVAFASSAEVDRSYARCLRILLGGDGYPMLATHDPRLIRIAGTRAEVEGRAAGSFEYQMLYGIRPAEQRRLASGGARMRVYVPYGSDWYGYLVRRLAERPANLAFFLRSLISTG